MRLRGRQNALFEQVRSGGKGQNGAEAVEGLGQTVVACEVDVFEPYRLHRRRAVESSRFLVSLPVGKRVVFDRPHRVLVELLRSPRLRQGTVSDIYISTERPKGRFVVIISLLGFLLAVDVLLRVVGAVLLEPSPFWAGAISIVPNVLDNIIAGFVAFVAVAWYYGGQPLSASDKRAAVPEEALRSLGKKIDTLTTAIRPSGGPGWTNSGIDEFVSQVDLSTVSRICVVAITGDVTVKRLCDGLDRARGRGKAPSSLRLEVLLRADNSSDSKRVAKRDEAYAALRGLRTVLQGTSFEIRDYSSVSPLHGILMEHSDQSFSAYMGFYDWKKSELSTRESANPNVLVYMKAQPDESPLDMFLSWFGHYWGKHQVHTLIFDFDDTLFQTTSAQVKGWVSAITKSLQNGLISVEDLQCDVVRPAESEAALTEKMTAIFLDEQQEKSIFDRIFQKARMPSAERLSAIRSIRQGVRDVETEKSATPIPDVAGHVRNLTADYQLVIISATSERTIYSVLRANELDVFPYVFGKEATHTWTNIEGKSPAFVRAANMIGVPFSRMVFVGDSDADFRTAKQLGLKFIESRFNAARYDRETLVSSREQGDELYVVGGPEKANLRAVIARIEGAMMSSKTS